MKNVLTQLAKSVSVPLGFTAADAAIQKKTFGSGTTLIILDEEMNDVIKIVKYLEDSGFLIKSVIETIKLGTLSASSLGNILAGKSVLRAGERTIRSDQYF